MKFGVVAAGGVGGYFGGTLAENGVDVTFVARGAHLAAIREHGLELRGPNESRFVRVKATDDPRTIGVVDVLLVAVKGWQLPAVLPTLPPMVGPNTTVIPLLNGVSAPTQLTATLGPEGVLGGLCNIMSYVGGPGIIEYKGAPASVTFGELSGAITKRVETIRATMEAGKVKVVVPEDIRAAMWRKFVFIASFGAVGAVARAPASVIRTIGATRELLERAVREAIAVGRGTGVALSDADVEKTMAYIDGLLPDSFASMARDLMAGRRSELDALPGSVRDLGRENGVATPVFDFLYASLLPTELAARQSTKNQ